MSGVCIYTKLRAIEATCIVSAWWQEMTPHKLVLQTTIPLWSPMNGSSDFTCMCLQKQMTMELTLTKRRCSLQGIYTRRKKGKRVHVQRGHIFRSLWYVHCNCTIELGCRTWRYSPNSSWRHHPGSCREKKCFHMLAASPDVRHLLKDTVHPVNLIFVLLDKVTMNTHALTHTHTHTHACTHARNARTYARTHTHTHTHTHARTHAHTRTHTRAHTHKHTHTHTHTHTRAHTLCLSLHNNTNQN